MIPLLPDSQVWEHLDEQSTANLQLQSSHVQAVFKKRRMLFNKKLQMQSLQELIIKEEKGK
jgi:hypothetical protein